MVDVEPDDMLYIQVQQIFKQQVNCDKDGKEFLQKTFKGFLLYQIKVHIVRYILANLSEKGWEHAVEAMVYYKKKLLNDS